MVPRPCATAAVMLALLLTPGAGQARVLDQSRIGAWQIAAVTDDRTGAALECTARTEAPSGIGLVLAGNPRGGWSLGLTGNLGAKAGEAYPVRLRVDRGAVTTATATVESEDRVRIPLGDATGFVTEFSRGRQLDADAGAERLTFPLRGTRAVVAEVSNCLRRLASRTELASTGATGGSPQPPVRADTASAADRRLDALTLQANVLSRAKLVGFELQPAAVPPRLTGHDVTWRAGDVVGSLRVLAGDGNPDAIRAELVSSDIRSCPDRFTAEASPALNREGATLFTTCAGEKGWAADYLALPREGLGTCVFAVMSAPDKADALRTTAAAIRAAALEVAPRPPSAP